MNIQIAAYRYPSIAGNGPDNYHEEDRVIATDELRFLSDQEKAIAEPLYTIPEGFALVPIEFIEQAASDNNHRSVGWRRSTINIFSKLMRQIEGYGKNTARPNKQSKTRTGGKL